MMSKFLIQQHPFDRIESSHKMNYYCCLFSGCFLFALTHVQRAPYAYPRKRSPPSSQSVKGGSNGSGGRPELSPCALL
jgi:hypothetical protein